MNKRADVTIATVILIILGLVVLVMLILGFNKGTDFFFNIFERGPTDLQSLVEACSLQVSANLNVDFCKYQLTDILGDEEVVNCEHPIIRSGLDNKGVIVPQSMTDYCAQNKATFLAKVCDKIALSKKEQTKVNGGLENCPINSLILSTTALNIQEEKNGEFKIKLASKPTNDVDIILSGSPDLIEMVTKSLKFTSENWNIQQMVEFKAKKLDSSNGVAFVELNGQNGLSGKVQVTITK